MTVNPNEDSYFLPPCSNKGNMRILQEFHSIFDEHESMFLRDNYQFFDIILV